MYDYIIGRVTDYKNNAIVLENNKIYELIVKNTMELAYDWKKM